MRKTWSHLLFCILCLTDTVAWSQQAETTPGNILINDFLKKEAKKSEGFLTTYIQDKKYYLEIPQDKLGRDLLVSITILKGAARQERTMDMRFGYGGDSMFDKLIRLVRNEKNIDIISPLPIYRKDSTNIYYEYYRHIIDPVIASLPIIASSERSYLIDITEMLTGDSELFSLKGGTSELKLGGYNSETSEIIDIQAFPENINFRSYRGYGLAEPAKGELPISRWEIVSSWYLLPVNPMQPRIADSRVGYFTYELNGLSTNPNEMERASIVTRWRLEPKPEDKEKYLKGELVEPTKPIVFYIDRATPNFLIPYFVKAVNAWQDAFTKAGFKNAIYAKLAPMDSSYNEGDIRYPLISYKASPIPNAYGPMVVDPRSGEIITSHIAIYHSVLDLLQRWYFVMCGTTDPRARKYPLDQSVIGELAATVLTHEVGHTLGLRHNFVGSTAYPTDSLRSTSFIRKNGLGASIMDYQRFNYVAQPSDNLPPEDLLPHIGVYDNFAIEWGYRYQDSAISLSEDTKQRRIWVTEKRKDPRNLFLIETELGDPRVQAEDNGYDLIKANRLGMKNLQTIMKHIEEWTETEDTDFFALRRRYLSVLSQYWNYVNHVLAYVGGHYTDRPDRNENLIVYQPVPKETQQQALDYLKEFFFKEQSWLFPMGLMSKTRIDLSTYDFEPTSKAVNKLLLKYVALHKDHQIDGRNLTVDELLDYIYQVAFSPQDDSRLTQHQKMIQRYMLEAFTLNAENPTNLCNGVNYSIKRIINKIKEDAKRQAFISTDYLTSTHYQTIYHFIILWENGKNSALINNSK